MTTTMTRRTAMKGAAAALALAAVVTTGTATVVPVAQAGPYPIVGTLGSTLQMTDTVGQVTFSWRVEGLKPSSDTMPDFPVTGKVWEATATVHAINDPVTPAVSQFNAVAPNQAVYRVLWEVAAPKGISAATIPAGATATGKVYFDVTGPAPTTVTMNNGIEDLMVWGP